MPEYKEISPSEIQVAHFNPARRVERSRLTGLLLSIRTHGILEPLVLARDYTLADGHRRLACAKLLELATVPVAIHNESPLSAAALWVVLNSDTAALSPSQWLAAVDAGLPLETPGFPESMRRRIRVIIELVGVEGLALLAEQNRSPHIMDAAERVANYVNRPKDRPFLKATLQWLITYSNAFNVRAALDEQIAADILEEAILENRELRRVWDIGE